MSSISVGQLLCLRAGWIPINQWALFLVVSCNIRQIGFILDNKFYFFWSAFSIWELVGFQLTNELRVHFYWPASLYKYWPTSSISPGPLLHLTAGWILTYHQPRRFYANGQLLYTWSAGWIPIGPTSSNICQTSSISFSSLLYLSSVPLILTNELLDVHLRVGWIGFESIKVLHDLSAMDKYCMIQFLAFLLVRYSSDPISWLDHTGASSIGQLNSARICEILRAQESIPRGYIGWWNRFLDLKV